MPTAQNFLNNSTEKQLNFHHKETCSANELFIKQLQNFIILEKNLELIEKIGEGMTDTCFYF